MSPRTRPAWQIPSRAPAAQSEAQSLYEFCATTRVMIHGYKALLPRIQSEWQVLVTGQ